MESITKKQYEYALERMEELLPFVHEDTPLNDKSEPSLSTTRRIVNILKLSPEQVLAI